MNSTLFLGLPFNVFWGLYLFAFAIACWVVLYFLYFRHFGAQKRCTACTQGYIRRYSQKHYGGMHIPLVEYTVNGKKYKVAGPHFKSASIKTVSTPFENPKTNIESNLTTREDLPDVLKVKIHKNSLVSATISPIMELYPIGSYADVYYNPNKPKEAYVQRYVKGESWLMVLLIVAAIALTISSIITFIYL